MNKKVDSLSTKKEIFNWGNLSKYRNEIYGFAILWIIIFHIFDAYKKINFNWTIIYICKNGNIGVDIFLLMAGICSYFSFQKSYNVKNFYLFSNKVLMDLFKVINSNLR